jgi:hypothetical protein
MDFRQYDNAIGRFLCIDALSEKNHYLSPYNFADGNPIFFSDPSGLTALKNEAISADEPYNANIELTKTASIGNYGLDFFGSGGGGGAVAGGGNSGGNVNVILFILNPSENKTMLDSYIKNGFAGWEFLFATDIQDGLEKLKKYSDGEIDNFVLYFHADGGELNMGSYDSVFENVVERNSIGSVTLSLFNAKSKEGFLAEGFSETTYNDILAFSQISKKVNANGKFIMPGCNIGSSSLFIEHIIKAGNLGNHDVYFNEGYGKYMVSTSKDNYSIKSNRAGSSDKSIINIKRGQEYIIKDLFINKNNNIPITLLK